MDEIQTSPASATGEANTPERTIRGYAKVTLALLVPLYADTATSVPSLKEEFLNDDTRWGIAQALIEDCEFKTEVELFDGTEDQAKAWIAEAAEEHAEEDEDLEDADEDDDLDEDDDED